MAKNKHGPAIAQNGKGAPKPSGRFAFRFGIGFRLLCLVILLVLLPGSIQVFTTVSLSRDSIRQDHLTTNLSHAKMAADFTSKYISAIQENIRAFATRPDVTAAILNDTPETLQLALAQFVEVQLSLQSAAVFDVTGIQRANSTKNSSSIGQSVTSDDWFQKVIETGKPYQSVPVLSKSTGKPVTPYSVPILDGNGQIQGMLNGIISLSELSDTIVKTDFGKTARASLIDTRDGGVIIAHTDPTRVMTSLPGKNAAATRLLAGESGAIETASSSGEMDLIGFALVPGLPWGIMVITPSATALSLVNTLIHNSVLITGLIVLSSSMLTLLLVIGITRPLQKLKEAATAIGMGNLDYKVDTRGKDEIGDLSRITAAMAQQLKQTLVSRDKLENEITERSNAELSLHQTRQNYETFFNTIDEFLFVLDEHGNIIHTNSTVINRLGYTPEELAGQSVLMIHPPDRHDEVGRIVGEMLNGTADYCPVPIITKSGIQIPVETRVSHGIWDSKPVIFGVTKDISKIKVSEEKFSKVFYVNPSACGLSDVVTGKYVEVNEAFHTLLGFDNDEVIGKTSVELGILTPENLKALRHKTSANGKTTNIEAELRAKNGDIKTVLLSAENVTVQDKQYRYTVVHNITERKQAEEARQRADRKYRSLIQNSHDIIYTLTPDGVFTFVSPAWTALLGHPLEQVVGQPFQIFVHPDDMPGCEVFLKSVIETGQRQEGIEYRVRHINGSWLWHTSSAVPLIDESGTAIGFEGTSRDITEHKLSSEALRIVNARHSAMITNISDVIGIIGTDGLMKYKSPNITRWFGWEPQDLVGTDGWLTVHPDDLERIQKEFYALLLKDNSVKTVEYRYKCKDGAYKWIELTATNLVHDPIINGVLLHYHDITERKQAELSISESEKKFRSLFSSMTEGVALHQITYSTEGEPVNYRIVDVNPSFETQTGIKAADVCGYLSTEAYKTDSPPFWETYERVARTGEPFSFESNFQPLGQTFAISVYSPKPGWFATVFSDITLRKQSEDALRESQNLFSTVANSSTAMVWMSGPDKLCTWFNKPWLEFTGRTMEQETGNGWAEGVYPDDFDACLKTYVDAFDKRQPFMMEYRLRHNSGEYRWILDPGLPRYDASGNFAGYIGSCFDITERKATENRIKASLAEKEVILKEIHHRVKNNMQVISSLLQMQSRYVKDKDDAELFRESRERIYSMSLVYNKLYDSENLAHIGFTEYVNDLVAGLIRSYNSNTGTITTRIEAGGVELGLDLAIPCGLIINEVISNSLKFAFPNGRPGEIRIIMRNHEGRIEMSLGDNGVGIPPGIDTNTSKTLGMSLLQTLAMHQLSGTLELKRENGTEYFISFPYKPQENRI